MALGTQTVSVGKDSRALGKAAGEIALALAGGTATDKIEGSAIFKSPGRSVGALPTKALPSQEAKARAGEGKAMSTADHGAQENGARRSLADTLELDKRLSGRAVAFAILCLVLHFATEGKLLTPRNIFNGSVQTVSVGIMATGMVFVIAARHIDLSVG